MARAVNNRGVAHDGAPSWFVLVAEEVKALFGQGRQTVSEAARTMGRAAAEKRKRDNRTIQERYDDFHARLKAEHDGGWPVSPDLIRKELGR